MGPSTTNVVVVGGGVGGLEALLALRDLAGDLVERTLVTPEDEFTYRPMAVGHPFARGHARRHPIAAIAADLGARHVRGTLARVDAGAHTITTTDGDKVGYDALLVAVGAGEEPVIPRALTWTPELDAEVYGGLLRDLEEGYLKRLAFVVPTEVAWVLPAYELALMTGWQAREMQVQVQITIVTPERAPLEVFGTAGSDAVQRDLDDLGIRVITGTDAATDRVDADRVVALPRAVGPRVAGLPADDRGFIPVDGHGRVEGVDDVWAAGDATNYPVKQGGLAAQQADAAAEDIGARAGAAVEPKPFQPVMRGVLLTGRGRAWLRNDPVDDEGAADRKALFWPPTKVAGRYLSPYLAALEGDDAQHTEPDGQPVELDLT